MYLKLIKNPKVFFKKKILKKKLIIIIVKMVPQKTSLSLENVFRSFIKLGYVI